MVTGVWWLRFAGGGDIDRALATTLDRLPPGARPDDSPDLEPTDIARRNTCKCSLWISGLSRFRALSCACKAIPIPGVPGFDAISHQRSQRRDHGGIPASNQRRLELAVSRGL